MHGRREILKVYGCCVLIQQVLVLAMSDVQLSIQCEVHNGCIYLMIRTCLPLNFVLMCFGISVDRPELKLTFRFI